MAAEFLEDACHAFSSSSLYIGAGASDLAYEAQENEHSFSVDPEQARILTVDDLRRMLHRIVKSKAVQLHQAWGSSYPMQFYCWHDEMAAQLRFSLVSAAATLPFRCRVLLVADVDEILQPFLESSYHPGIPWSELEQAAQNDLSHVIDASEYTLKVWRTVL